MSLVRTTAEVCPHDGAKADVVQSLPAGTRIGDYSVVRTLGEGGMGAVYEVRHEVLHRRAAMKFLHAELTQNADLVTRFLQEAKAVNVISHDNIIDIYDYGEGDGGVVYFVMEFLEGEALTDLLERRGRLPIDLTVHIFSQIMRALAAAHKRNIVHRDLKPDNVYLARREADPHFVKLLDFGIARMRGEGAVEGLTRAGTLMGTPQFMSPEQATGKEVDARSDIFSLGVMMYRAVVGTLPFDGPTLQALLVAVITTEPPPPRQAAPDANIPPALDRLIVRSMGKEPDARYATVDEMLADLEKVKQEAGIRDQALTMSDRAAPTTPDAYPSMPAEMATAMDGPPAHMTGAGATAVGGTTHVVPGARSRGWAIPVAIAGLVAAGVIGVFAMRSGGGASTPDPTTTAGATAGPNNTGATTAPAGPTYAALIDGDKLSEARTRARDELTRMLTTGEPDQRRKVIEALTLAATPRVAPLLYTALGGAPQVRLQAAEALRELALPEAAPKVRAALANSGNKLRVPLAAVLAALGDPEATPILEAALAGEPGEQLIAAEALAGGGDAAKAAKAAKAAEAREVLRQTLASTPPGRDRWLTAARGLVAAAGTPGAADADKALRAELSRPEPRRAVAAAEILARAGDADARDFLARVADDPAHEARGHAALALARTGDDRALGFVADGLTGDGDAPAHAAAIAARLAGQGGKNHARALAAVADTSAETLAGLTARAALLAL